MALLLSPLLFLQRLSLHLSSSSTHLSPSLPPLRFSSHLCSYRMWADKRRETRFKCTRLCHLIDMYLSLSFLLLFRYLRLSPFFIFPSPHFSQFSRFAAVGCHKYPHARWICEGTSRFFGLSLSLPPITSSYLTIKGSCQIGGVLD